jgi:pimeloyl-ACP methyl ester carboxylesterase
MEFEEPQGRAVAVWFGPEESPLFGLVNSGGRDIRGAVILCPPLGREEKDCYSTFAQLAAALARVGFLALRFDYRSTADSFDRSSTDDSGCGLLDDVRSAIDFVRDLGAPSVALVGMRMGALLAGLVSATEPVEAVVMWDPCSSGHAFVREQRMLSLRIPVDHSDTDHIPDFHLPVAMLRELSTMKMDETTASLAGRVLLLTRDDGLEDHRLVGHLTSPRTEHRKVAGQPELLDLPTPFQVVPAETVALIASWIDAAMPVVTRAVTLPTADEVTVPLPPAKDDRPRSEAGRPTAVVERALRLGSLGLFAISTEPNRGHKGPTCIFVSVANEHRIGPGRLWVELSRRLAAYGFHSVRLDLSGYGDSPARGAPPSVYSISAVDDVVEAARSLRPDDPSDVLLFGLCSSGYHVLEAATRLHPRAVCALNPTVSFSAPETRSGLPPDPRRRFFLPQTTFSAKKDSPLSFRRVEQRYPAIKWLGARFPVFMLRFRGIGRRAIIRMSRPYETLVWLSATRPGHSRSGPAQQVSALVRSGTNVLLICGPDEMQPFRRATARSEWPGTLELEVIPALDHALRRPRDRDEVTRLILERARESFRAERRDPAARRTTQSHA